MSLNSLSKELRNLTYPEMMQFAEEVYQQLKARSGESKQTFVIAEILSQLNIASPEITDAQKNEAKYLKEIFARKRSVVIKSDGGGFSISCDSLPGSQVVGLDLRQMFPMMIDQCVTMHVLQKMK